MTDRIFADDIVDRFRAGYPDNPTKLAHCLLGHPLLELEAIAALAQRMRPRDVEYNAADLPIGVPQEELPANGLSIADTIRSIEENGSWMVLKLVQQDPAYRDLLHAVLAELKPAIEAVTGPMLQLEGFIFVSSPNAVTPLHFDPEYNILCQIRGSKCMTVFPAGDEEMAAPVFVEDYHAGGPRNLPWRDEFESRGQAFELAPGEAVYVPVTSPHWVRNGPDVSISFSITWRSRWSFHEADARAFNKRLRRLGVEPALPHRFPRSNLVKSVAHRTLRKVEQAAGLRR
ncbi:MAG TPA: cupin-like domain-containing protein [Allosphingosinicella sp.]|nr:cupin-like domain-containing protein [Allosphingosinicella sp.]